MLADVCIASKYRRSVQNELGSIVVDGDVCYAW